MKFKNVFIIGIVVLLLCGCGKTDNSPKKPDNVSQRVYNLGCKVVEVVDKYMDGDILSSEVYETIKDLSNEIEISVDDNFRRDNIILLSVAIIEMDIFSIKVDIDYGMPSNDNDLNDLLEHRNSLAGYLELK